MNIALVVAAGKGTRMKSDLPKVVHTIEGKCLVDYAIEAAEGAGAGEICLNSIDTDGVRGGFDLEMLKAVCARVRIPVIASGGAGKLSDFATVFEQTDATAALAASLFHFGELTIPQVKADCRSNGIPMR